MKINQDFGRTHRSPEFVSGLVTGEGCFYADTGFDPKYKLNYRVRLAFCVEMRYDDISNLEEIRNHLKCGSLYYLNYGRYKGDELKGWKDHAKLRVSNFDSITGLVIPFFKKHQLYGRKQISFNIFNQIAEMMIKKDHLSVDGIKNIKSLVEQMKLHNKKGIGTR